MSELIYRATEKTSTVIPDPYEMDEIEPHADGNNLLWFGHKVNLKVLGSMPKIHDIKIVTGPGVVKGATFYSPQNLQRALLEANIALFPTVEGGKYKSNNRVLNAIRMGVFPVCGNHPSYEEFKMVWQGNVHTGIRWAKHFKSDLNEAQNQIREQYSPETIGGLWNQALSNL